MSLYINNNMMAANAARNLSNIYGQLSTSVQRLSSGLRINSAADDAAGLAVRELMRADIAVIEQGVRNASDAISMIQTAEGAMSVIDEKLIRMKELAEQASTGTYTTAQRAIMNSEYQAMAAEIDRIANATDFNGVKLLDGSLEDLHSGSGLKVHFGTGNEAAEDYYFVSIGDMQATTITGLQVGGPTVNVPGTGSVWRTNSLDLADTDTATLNDTGFFGIQTSTDGTTWSMYGFQRIGNSSVLDDVVDNINAGSGGTNTVDFSSATTLDLVNTTISVGSVQYIFSTVSSGGVGYFAGYSRLGIQGYSTASIANLFKLAVNERSQVSSAGEVVATIDPSDDENIVNLWDYDLGESDLTLSSTTGTVTLGSGTFSGGGALTNITAAGVMDGDASGYELQLTGDEGVYIRIIQPSGQVFNISAEEEGGVPTTGTTIQAYNLEKYGGAGPVVDWDAGDEVSEWFTIEPQDAEVWDGADILTQSAAQAALAQIDAAINTKDTARANLGAIQNRLENTITNLEIQAENLQSAESRISDVDVATEMTEFTSNNILAQAATAMLAQANSLPQLALQLLG